MQAVEYNNQIIELTRINSYEEYINNIVICIEKSCSVILEHLLARVDFLNYRTQMINDNKIYNGTFIKSYLIDQSIKCGDLRSLIIFINFFGIDKNIPSCGFVRELKFDERRNKVINKETDVEYLLDSDHLHLFDERIDIRYLYKGVKHFSYVKELFERQIRRKMNDYEIAKLKYTSKRYKEFIDEVYPFVIKDIKQNEDKPITFEDCRELLYEYLDRYPTNLETNKLWDATLESDWENDSTEEYSSDEEYIEDELSNELDLMTIE